MVLVRPVAWAEEATISEYLSRMTTLEVDFPAVTFVYMTGHSDGSGLAGNLHTRDQQIRAYCEERDKYLYDFYDIECYDPDGNYYGDMYVNDACGYDSDGDASHTQDANWATAWQATHPSGYWACSSAHSEPLNANRKAMAAWRLFALIASEMD